MFCQSKRRNSYWRWRPKFCENKKESGIYLRLKLNHQREKDDISNDFHVVVTQILGQWDIEIITKSSAASNFFWTLEWSLISVKWDREYIRIRVENALCSSRVFFSEIKDKQPEIWSLLEQGSYCNRDRVKRKVVGKIFLRLRARVVDESEAVPKLVDSNCNCCIDNSLYEAIVYLQ